MSKQTQLRRLPALTSTSPSTSPSNAPSKAPSTTPPVFKPAPIPKPDVSHLPLLEASALPSTVLMQTLAKALSMCRDHGSETEAQFVGWLVNRLPVTLIDAAGNVHVDLRSYNTQRTLFTAHTDTVHHGGGHNPVRIDGKYWRADGQPLGADDGSGVALLCHMIERGVAGYYIFFRGEECGGLGSSWLADNMPDVLAEFDRAVAFDRAGYSDVITHQSRGRCCSDAFAEGLSTALCDQGQLYMPCDSGVYTDTAEFVEIIPECTNLSVGYKAQHGDREEQDVSFLIELADALVQIDWDALPVVRRPGKPAAKSNWYTDSYPKATPTVGHGRHGDFLEPRQIDLFDEEEELFDAIQDALDGHHTRLMVILGEHLTPGNPDQGRRYLNTSALTYEVLIEAQFSLEAGWGADGIVADLVDTCNTI